MARCGQSNVRNYFTILRWLLPPDGLGAVASELGGALSSGMASSFLRALADRSVNAGFALSSCVGGVAAPTLTGSGGNIMPSAFSRANIPATFPIGTLISRDTPLKRALNCTLSLSIVRLRVAPLLMLSTISLFFTYSIGTRVVASTRTLRYGVKPQSQHHSKMARRRYGLVEISLTGD